ncbi:hypothetical protein SCP_0407990 [Sparassis crispa]|uniref:Uncharacterized protein n=1 Tax=Sparassis crispa TaxID=139825 RepID=A0A401GJS6_9APHY|nr:hypothetical protein SCP_0407990 [Sparassis crispa]GBE82415.1 hypothetical protein SCP_0407990 [Sparassis crispa]
MSPHLSQQLQECIVTWRQEGKPIREIAELAGCSERTVSTILSLYRDYGIVSNPNARLRGRPHALDTGDVNYLSALLQANPVLYLDELQEQLIHSHGTDASIATLSRALRHLSLTLKKITKEAAERDDLLRATWIGEYGDIPMEYFIWLDESSVDDVTNQRRRGWSGIGRACVWREMFIRGQRYSVLSALSIDGIIALDIFEGSVNKERFIKFVEEELAPKLTPYPGPRSVVVMDNCAIHHDEEVRQIVVDDCGAKLIYLPPYSPNMNPIEQAFFSIKAWLRRHEAAAIDADVRPWLIHQASLSVTPEHAEHWIMNCGYS